MESFVLTFAARAEEEVFCDLKVLEKPSDMSLTDPLIMLS